MIGDVYDFRDAQGARSITAAEALARGLALHRVRARPMTLVLTRAQAARLREAFAWAEQAEPREAAASYERLRKLKGAAAACAVAALGVATFVGLCLVWSRK